MDGLLRANRAAIDLYLVRDSENSVDLPSEIQRELILSLRSIVSLDTSFDSTQRYLLYKMYNDQFQVSVNLRSSNIADT